jgi:DNA-binding response OmpR family regulator
VSDEKNNAAVLNRPSYRERLLVVDDDRRQGLDLSEWFARVSLDVVVVTTAEEAWKHGVPLNPSIIISEIDLPGMSGFDLCRRLKAHRQTADIPLLFATHRDQEIDLVVGFELGACDYVVKPLNQREFVLRVMRILRRVYGDQNARVASFGRLVIHVEEFLAVCNGRPLTLSPTELQVLGALVRANGRVLTRGEIIERAWRHQKSVLARTVDAHIKSLRRKLEGTGHKIVTIRSAGYCLRFDKTSTLNNEDPTSGAAEPNRQSLPASSPSQEMLRKSCGV